MKTTLKHPRSRAYSRFQPALIERLKSEAKRRNVSVNSFVEALLYDMLYCTPNATTVAAMQETLFGEYASVIKKVKLKCCRI